MMTTRRRFFGLVAGTPLVAKAAADNVVAALSGIDVTGINSDTPGGLYDYGSPCSDVTEVPWFQKLKISSLHIKNFGLPGYVEEIYREESKRVHVLDPDIANKKSWSMAFKVCCQRERNYQNRLKNIDKYASRTWQEKALEKVLGFTFPVHT